MIKNVTMKMDAMSNVHLVADKHEMLVMVSWEWNDYSNEWYGRYSVKTTLDFAAIGDRWDIEYKAREHKHENLIKVLVLMATQLLDLHKPAAKEVQTEEASE